MTDDKSVIFQTQFKRCICSARTCILMLACSSIVQLSVLIKCSSAGYVCCLAANGHCVVPPVVSKGFSFLCKLAWCCCCMALQRKLERLPKRSDRHVDVRKCIVTPSGSCCMQHLLSASMWQSQVDLTVMCNLH